jgi:hypothetical protein
MKNLWIQIPGYSSKLGHRSRAKIIDIELLGLADDSFGWAMNQRRESSKRKDVAHSATSTRHTKSTKGLEQLCI